MQFSDLYGLVRTKLQDSADTRWTLQEKKDALNLALRDFCTRTRITEGLYTLAQNGASTSEYVAPAGTELAEIRRLTTGNFRLFHITTGEAFSQFAGQWKTITGSPLYAVYGDYKRTTDGGLIVKVIPDPGVALTDLDCEGLAVPVLSADTDVPPFSTIWHDCLADRACSELLLKNDDGEDNQQAALFRQQYEAVLLAAAKSVGRGFDAGVRAVRVRYV